MPTTSTSLKTFPALQSLLYGIAFFLPLVPLVSLFAMGAYGLRALIIAGPGAIRNIPRHMFLPVALYLVYVAGMFFTTNTDAGTQDLVSKLPFLLVPLLLPLTKPGHKEIRRTMVFFCAGIGLLSMFFAVRSIAAWLGQHDSGAFFYATFTSPWHPTYYSLYVNLAILFLFSLLLEKKGGRMFRIVLWVAYSFGVFVILLASSRMAILAAGASLILWVIMAGLARRGKPSVLLAAIALPLVMFLVAGQFSGSHNRFQQPVNQAPSVTSKDEGSLEARIHVWQASTGLIREHFWTGVGTGDVKEELHALYEKQELLYALKKNLNAHNQFIQSMLAVGIVGCLLTLSLFLWPGWLAWRRRDALACTFLLSVFLNCLSESILERQAGILFFAFFFVLLSGGERQEGMPAASGK